MGPAHRFRKIKGAPAIKSAMSRGVKNSGHIEIENDPSEDEAEPGFYEVREFGHTYKLSENSIKLDFISRYAASIPSSKISDILIFHLGSSKHVATIIRSMLRDPGSQLALNLPPVINQHGIGALWMINRQL